MGDTAESNKAEPVTISAPPEVVTVDPQNPLPEPSFKWRRILAHMIVLASLALTWHAAEAFHDLGAPDQLLSLSKWTIGFAALIATYYYIAPSAAELTQIIQSARIIKGGISLARDKAERPARAAQERDSGPSTGQDSREAPERAPEPPDGPEIDYAPTGRSQP